MKKIYILRIEEPFELYVEFVAENIFDAEELAEGILKSMNIDANAVYYEIEQCGIY